MDTILSEMGITQWRLRDAPTPTQPSEACVHLVLLHDVDKARYLILVGPEGSAASMTSAQKTAMKENIKNLGWAVKDCAFAEWVESEDESIPLQEQCDMLGIKAAATRQALPVTLPVPCQIL